MKRALAAAVILLALLAVAYGSAVTRRETSYRQYMELGDAALASGDTFAAIEAFSSAIAVHDESMVAYLKRGEAYQRQDDLEASLRDLRRAADLDPLATRPRELLGDVNHALLRYGRAAQRYQEYLDIDDQSPRVLYKLALSHYRAGQFTAGVAALRKAVALEERFPEAYYLLGLCLRDAQQTAEALVALERSILLAPALLPAREELADLYGRLGRPDDRIAQLEALQALDPGASRDVALGLAHAEVGDVASAVQTLGRAARRYPAHRYTYVALGRVWLETAQAQNDRVALDRALDALQSAAGVQESSETLMLFGRALLLAADVETAERMLQRATEKLPVEPLAFYYLAEAAEALGHDAVAYEALLDYHALVGDTLERSVREQLAIRVADVSLRLNQPGTAATWLERAVAVNASDVSLLVRLAEAQWAAARADAARATLARALELAPANAAARALARRVK